MKKSTKVWLFVAGIVFFIGLIALIVSLALGWDTLSSKSKDLETQTISIQQDFDRISLECDTQDVYLLPSTDGECRVVFVTEEYYDNTAEVENGCLQVKSIDHSSFIDHVGISFGEASSITVYLPKLEYDALVINADTSDISIPKEFSFGTVDISLTTGDTSFLASVTDLLRIHATTGDIQLENLSAGELDLSVDTGRINGNSLDCAGAFTLSVTTGKVVLEDVSCKSFTSTGDTGSLSLTSFLVDEMMSIRRTSGDVKLDGCDAAELQIETDTGDITGSLLTDKIFIVKTDTGKIQVPETTAGGTCKLTTDTGDIKIEIK